MLVQLNNGQTVPMSEALERAWRLIDRPWKWCRIHTKTRGIFGQDEHCSFGALREVISSETSGFEACGRILTANGPRLDSGHGIIIDPFRDYITYNDDHLWWKVRQMWLRAIAAARRQERKEFMDKLMAVLEDEHVVPESVPVEEDRDAELTVSAL